MTQLEAMLSEWDRSSPLIIPARGRKLPRLQTTVRAAIERLEIDATARAEGSSQSVIVEAEE